MQKIINVYNTSNLYFFFCKMQDEQNINYMQYMWIKHKLLDWITPFVLELMKWKDWYIIDLMSWTCSVSSHLKQYYNIITNDVQYYSYVISKAIIENDSVFPNKDELIDMIDKSKNQKKYSFFTKNYSDKYFTSKVCRQIDNISYEIDKLEWIKKYIYKYILMLSMNKIRLTTWHYAQFLEKNHPRMKIFLERDLYEQMFFEINNFSLNKNYWTNVCLNYEDKELFKRLDDKKISLIYLDPPYTVEQYSRFYHVLETVCKYDNPKIDSSTKWLYRIDRYKSDFSYKTKVISAFERVFKFWNEKKSNIIISYSDKWVLKIDKIKELLWKYYKDIRVEYKKHFHSSLSKWSSELNEVLIIWETPKNVIDFEAKDNDNKEDIYIKNYEKDLIRYIWNKRKLLKSFLPIFNELKNNGGNSFIDLFSGSWSISRLARWMWFYTIANDWEDYSYIINKSFLEYNKKLDNFDNVWWLDNIINLLNNIDIKKWFFYNNFWENSKKWRKFFTSYNSWKIDWINDYIDELFLNKDINENEFFYLKTCLINSISQYANITWVFRAYLKSFNNKSSEKILLSKIFIPDWPIWKAIKEDAETYKCNSDIVYIDPPYNEHQYSPNYHILNHIYYKRDILNWVAWVYDYSNTKSNFCNEEWAKKWFINILKNINAKYILVSYNNNWLIRVWELYEMLSKYWNTKIEVIDYPRYRAHSKRTPLLKENYEYLFICNVWKDIIKKEYERNIDLLKSHPWYNRRRKDDQWRFKQRNWI